MIIVMAERFVLVIAAKIQTLTFLLIVAVTGIAMKRNNANQVNANLLHGQLPQTIPKTFK